MATIESSELSTLLPAFPEAIARFAFARPATANASGTAALRFFLRMNGDGDFSTGDYLCRAYPIGADGHPIADAASSWNRSPHFEALYAYVPAFSGPSLLSLPPFELENASQLLVLIVQPWRGAATTADVTVEACLLQREARVGSRTVRSYEPVPVLPGDA